MIRCIFALCAAYSFLLGTFHSERLWGAEPEAEAERLFAKRVWPLLQAKCLACHGNAAEIAGGLDLRTLDAARRGGDSGQSAWKTGEPEQSPIWRAIRRQDDEFSAMPPKENDQLTPPEIELVRQWIAGGAAWPDERRRQVLMKVKDAWDAEEGETVATSGGLSPEWDQRRYRAEDLWAYRPLQKPAVPMAAGDHPVDRFIHHKLSESGLPAAPRADRRTLIRRVTFDLTGLPPSPQDIAAFLEDPASDQQAFASVVERLLASPHYGEHWGRHWLDVVRYADSSGFANDYERGNAWRYRDYVVRSFNSDKPFDVFVREQVAGDELAQQDADATRRSERIIAAGFLRMGPWELTGMEVAKIARQRFLDDVTDSVGQVVLAHPLQCARCHDHKFDPIPTRDYYRVQAVFGTTQLAERQAPFLPSENTNGFEEREYLLERKRHFEAIVASLDKKEEAAARQWCAERGLKYVSRNQGLKEGVPEDQLPPRHVGFSVEDYGLERIARKGLERLKWELERYEPVALSVYSGRTPDVKSVNAPQRMRDDRLNQGELERTAILSGGDPFSPVQPVEPGALSALDRASAGHSQLASFPTAIEGRRLALAAWLTHPDNPLTARVIVNRVWGWHFGQGLAANPNNFGATGKKPTHPELLDWLAVRLQEQGWSLKALHRLILNSETYCRSVEHPDPELWRQRDPLGTSYAAFLPRRLSADELRDAQLFVTGELNLTVGGIPIRPEMNLEAALQPRQVMGTFAAAWQPSPRPEQRHRRSLYALRLRGLRDPFLEVFNEPSPDLSCEAREASLVTPQVFTLFNSDISYSRAVAFAARLRRESNSESAAIERAFQLAFGRQPTDVERDSTLAHWRAMTERHQTLKLAPLKYPREVIRQAVEENTGEKFQFSERLEMMSDFVPDLRPQDVDVSTRGLAEVCLVLLNANEFLFVY